MRKANIKPQNMKPAQKSQSDTSATIVQQKRRPPIKAGQATVHFDLKPGYVKKTYSGIEARLLPTWMENSVTPLNNLKLNVVETRIEPEGAGRYCMWQADLTFGGTHRVLEFVKHRGEKELETAGVKNAKEVVETISGQQQVGSQNGITIADYAWNVSVDKSGKGTPYIVDFGWILSPVK